MTTSRAPDDFIDEASEILEQLARDVSQLDAGASTEPDPELVNGIFRAAHTLKGLSGMFGFDQLASLAHRAEDVLDALRLGRVELSDELVDALNETVELFHALLKDLSSGESTPANADRSHALSQRLGTLSVSTASVGADVLDELALDSSVRGVFTEYEEHRLRENLKRDVDIWKIRVSYDLSDFDERLKALHASLRKEGELLSTLPSSQPAASGNEIAFDLLFGATMSKTRAESIVGPLATVTLIERKRRGSETAPIPFPAMPGAPVVRVSAPLQSLRSLTQTVRVDIRQLDALMNVVGELLLIRGNIQRLAEGAQQGGAGPMPKMWSQEVMRETRALERRLGELQKSVLDVRMVPLGQVFDKLARLMRRLVKESGKSVDFQVSGGDVELDKLIVEELSDPLMHLLRNALDHGVEPGEQRVANGKPAEARIGLRAQQVGNHVSIVISDDGAGMNEARIRQVAFERELANKQQLDALPRREVLNLVFLPGFSTKKGVTDLSGRGVGLDVVKTNISRLSGLIDIESEPGKGTSFVLTLPLTLAIIRALMVETAGQVYAIPLNSVLEIVSITSADLRTVERKEVLSVRGQTVPFVRLSKVYGMAVPPADRHFVVVVGLAQQRLGIGVDALMGQHDIVTKPLVGRLSGLPGISGATELGDRRPVLVLDVAGLVEELQRPQVVGA